MIDDDLFTDGNKVQIITPYRKLRNLRGWSLEKAADIFRISRRSLIDIELGRKDAPKWLVRTMDKVYGCNGELIDYWLPRFSVAPIRREKASWITTLLSAMTRCMTSVITGQIQKLNRMMARLKTMNISRLGKWSGEK